MTKAGNLQVNNIAYSPMLEGGPQNIISSSFSGNSYIYESTPAYTQKDIWTWSATFADFPGNYAMDSMNIMAQPTYVSGSCAYSYNYMANTTLNSIYNYYIPFNSVNVIQVGASKQVTYNTFQAEVLPFLTFNYFVTAPNNQNMYNSYDIFSPWSYNTPADSIEMFPINTPGDFFFGYNGMLLSASADSVRNGAIVKFINKADPMLLSSSTGNLFYDQNIIDPISIAAIPDDYIFVLNYSSSKSDWFLFVLKLIPHGDYNMTGKEPSSVQKDVGGTAWFNNWKAYWSNTINAQNYTVYVVNTIDLAPYINQFLGEAYSGMGIDKFIAKNISVDDAGDVFIAGSSPYSYTAWWAGFIGTTVTENLPGIMKIPDVLGSPSPSDVIGTTGDWSLSSGATDEGFTEIAVSPDGAWVYGADPNYGLIYQFNSSLAQNGNPIDLTFGGQKELGLPQLSIPYYLFKGGLYSIKFDGNIYANVMDSNNNADPGTDFDSQAFHHPIGLANVNGYVYVLDDWWGTVGQKSSCWWWFIGCSTSGGTYFDILLLRALDSTGSNVPLNPTLFNDLYTNSSCSGTFNPTKDSNGKQYTQGECVSVQHTSDLPVLTCNPSAFCSNSIKTCEIKNGIGYGWKSGLSESCVAKDTSFSTAQPGTSTYYTPSSGYYFANMTWPPYGWILSANIDPSSSSNSITFCSDSECTISPSSMPSSYSGSWLPLAPLLLPYPWFYPSAPYGMYFSMGYDGTMNIFFRKFASGLSIFNELLIANFSVENYTKYFDGNLGYACYTDFSTYNGVCKLPSVIDMSKVSPPVYTATSPFAYLENLGSASLPTITGSGIQSVMGCAAGATSSQCSAGGGKTVQHPNLTVEQTEVGWGVIDQITAQTDVGTNNTEIVIDSTVVAKGTGATGYSICSGGISTCLAPGVHKIYAKDTTANTQSEIDITVDATPQLVFSPQVQTYGQQEIITATPSDSTDVMSIFVDGNPVVTVPGSAPGSVVYTESTLGSNVQVKSYTINAFDSTKMTQTVSKLVVIPSQPSTSGIQPAATSMTGSVGGYALIPYEYTFDIAQKYANIGVAQIAYTWNVPYGLIATSGCTSTSNVCTVIGAITGNYAVSVGVSSSGGPPSFGSANVIVTSIVGVYYNPLDTSSASAISTKTALPTVPYVALTEPPVNSIVVGGPYPYNSPPGPPGPPWYVPITLDASGNIIGPGNQCPLGPYYIGSNSATGLMFVFGTTTADTSAVANSFPGCPTTPVGVYYHTADLGSATLISLKTGLSKILDSANTVPSATSVVVGGPYSYGSTPPWWFMPMIIDASGNIIAPNNQCPSSPYYIGSYYGLTFAFGTTTANTVTVAKFYPNCPTASTTTTTTSTTTTTIYTVTCPLGCYVNGVGTGMYTWQCQGSGAQCDSTFYCSCNVGVLVASSCIGGAACPTTTSTTISTSTTTSILTLGVYYHTADKPPADIISSATGLPTVFDGANALPVANSIVVGGPYSYNSPPWFVPMTIDLNGNINSPDNQCPLGPYYIGSNSMTNLIFVFGTTTANTLAVAQSFPGCPSMPLGVYYHTADLGPAILISAKTGLPRVLDSANTVAPMGSIVVGGPYSYGSTPPWWFVPMTIDAGGNIISPNNMCLPGPYYIGLYYGLLYVFGTTAANTVNVAKYYPGCPTGYSASTGTIATAVQANELLIGAIGAAGGATTRSGLTNIALIDRAASGESVAQVRYTASSAGKAGSGIALSSSENYANATTGTAIKKGTAATTKVKTPVMAGGGSDPVTVLPAQSTIQLGGSVTLTVPSACPPPPPLPPDTESTFTVFSYALTAGSSDQLQTQIEGGPSYLNYAGNTTYYIANITNAHLILPPWIQYNLQNDKLFGSIWINATYCTSAASSSSSYLVTDCGTGGGDCKWAHLGGVNVDYGIPIGTSPDPNSAYKCECDATAWDPQYNYYICNPGYIYVGGKCVIKTPEDCSVNNQAVLNATRQLEYFTNIYTKYGGNYETFLTLPYPGIQYGPSVSGQTPITTPAPREGGSPVGAANIPNSIGFEFISTSLPVSVPLFDLYKQMIYDSPLNLVLNATSYCTGTSGSCASPHPLRGYQQLIYVMTDRFNNLVYVPVETDVSDPVSINMTVGTQIDPSNSNMTNLNIDGYAGVYSDFGTVFTPLANNNIYLYFDRNLDYASFSSLDQSSAVQGPLRAIECAYSILDPTNPFSCVQSNPVYTNPGDNRQPNSQLVTYAPSYNSIGSCSTPTLGLLSQEYFKCNIKNNPSGADLSDTCPNTGALEACTNTITYPQYAAVASCLNSPDAQPDPQSYCMKKYPNLVTGYPAYINCAKAYTLGSTQFCEPTTLYSGNGICTSQIGLMQVVTTNTLGYFSFNTVACGSRQDTVTAQYYGWPPPEPVGVLQLPLSLTANIINGKCGALGCKTVREQEFNYYFAPTQVVETIQIGLVQLGYGNIGFAALIVSIASFVLLAFWKRVRCRFTRGADSEDMYL
jgi:hypothetical protein